MGGSGPAIFDMEDTSILHLSSPERVAHNFYGSLEVRYSPCPASVSQGSHTFPSRRSQVGKREATFAVFEEYLSVFFFSLKIVLQKQCYIQPAIMLKAFPWKTIAVLRKRFTRGPKGVMSYPTAPARDWELSLVSGFKLERSGEIHSYRIPPLSSLQIILHRLWPWSPSETSD